MPAEGGWWAQLAIQRPRVNVVQKRRPEPLRVPERPATALLRSPTSREMASLTRGQVHLSVFKTKGFLPSDRLLI